MRSPLLRFQTPAAPRRAVGFFGFGGDGLPRRASHPAYFGSVKVTWNQSFQPTSAITIARATRGSQRPFLVQRIYSGFFSAGGAEKG
jgi:hypothetical protein